MFEIDSEWLLADGHSRQRIAIMPLPTSYKINHAEQTIRIQQTIYFNGYKELKQPKI